MNGKPGVEGNGGFSTPVEVEVATVLCGGPGLELPVHCTSPVPRITRLDNRDNRSTPCQAYQQILENSDSELLIYVHDDVTIYDTGWLKRVVAQFEECPNAAVVGLGGAPCLGHPDLYKVPYEIGRMARAGWSVGGTPEARTGGSAEGGALPLPPPPVLSAPP